MPIKRSKLIRWAGLLATTGMLAVLTGCAGGEPALTTSLAMLPQPGSQSQNETAKTDRELATASLDTMARLETLDYVQMAVVSFQPSPAADDQLCFAVTLVADAPETHMEEILDCILAGMDSIDLENSIVTTHTGDLLWPSA